MQLPTIILVFKNVQLIIARTTILVSSIKLKVIFQKQFYYTKKLFRSILDIATPIIISEIFIKIKPTMNRPSNVTKKLFRVYPPIP